MNKEEKLYRFEVHAGKYTNDPKKVTCKNCKIEIFHGYAGRMDRINVCIEYENKKIIRTSLTSDRIVTAEQNRETIIEFLREVIKEIEIENGGRKNENIKTR